MQDQNPAGPPPNPPRYALPSSPYAAMPVGPAPAPRGQSAWVIVLLILLVVMVGLCVISSLFNMGGAFSGSGLSAGKGGLRERVVGGDRDAEDFAAVIPISGVIAEGGDGGGLFGPGKDLLGLTEQRIEMAVERGAKAIILEIDSPGGGVWASAWLHRLIERTKRDAKIPFIALFKNVAASGGYYIAAPADWIIAAPSTITGSIGVIMTHFDVRGLTADKLGVRYEGFTSAPQKDILSPFREVSDQERAHLQQMVQQMYDEFLDVVVTGRGGRVTRESVMALESKILTGIQAKAVGLVDELGWTEEAHAKAKDLAKVSALRLVQHDPEPGLFDALFQARAPTSLTLPGGARFALEENARLRNTPFLFVWEGGL